MSTLKEFKEKVLSFIEEYESKEQNLTKDVDIADKINLVINAKMFEVARYKKIYASDIIEVNKDGEWNCIVARLK